MYTDILIPTDGSHGAQAAIEYGLEIAQQYDAIVHALYVVDTRVSRSGVRFSKHYVRKDVKQYEN